MFDYLEVVNGLTARVKDGDLLLSFNDTDILLDAYELAEMVLWFTQKTDTPPDGPWPLRVVSSVAELRDATQREADTATVTTTVKHERGPSGTTISSVSHQVTTLSERAYRASRALGAALTDD